MHANGMHIARKKLTKVHQSSPVHGWRPRAVIVTSCRLGACFSKEIAPHINVVSGWIFDLGPRGPYTGLQFTGEKYDDLRFLSIARWLEQKSAKHNE